MVCLKIVNLLSKENCPHVFAEKFYYVEIVGETGTVTRESVR